MTAEMTPSFVAECTLGRLAKWLRLAGFDTAYVTGRPEARRLMAQCRKADCLILTRTLRIQRQLPSDRTIFIEADAPLNQVRQVMRRLDLNYSDLRPLTICALCNQPLAGVEKSELQHRVPDYTFRRHEVFRECGRCGRIYWPGSHARRWIGMMRRWFESGSHDPSTRDR
jgi:hypothetical protein